MGTSMPKYKPDTKGEDFLVSETRDGEKNGLDIKMLYIRFN